MNKIKYIVGILFILSSLVASASAPVLIDVPVDHIYSPKGFDSNDKSEIIVSGWLPNLCHKSPQSKVVVKDKVINIQIQALHQYDNNNLFCPEMIVPFVEIVDVGMLDKGNYKVVVNGHSPNSLKSELFVSESISNSVDEHVYANVDYIEKSEGSRMVNLIGYNPSDCFVFDKIEYVDNGKDVFSILPKMKQISDFCPMKMVPFNLEMEVPNNLKSDKVLLHVRVMNGKSVNSLFNNKNFK